MPPTDEAIRPSLTPGQVLAVAAVVVIGGVLRFSHLRSGVPYAIGVDEPEIMARAVAMMKTGDFNPHFFDWPSLTIYLQFVLVCLTFLREAMHGVWNNLDQVSAADFYVVGRSLTATFGSATVLVTFFAARRWGFAIALIAAALMAVMPYHVRESHYALADVPTAFFTTLTWLLTLRALDRPGLSAFAWGGLAAGLAASSKYNGCIAVVMPLFAAVAAGGSVAAIVQRVLVISACDAGGFLLGTPYALLDLPKFLNDYARLAAIFAHPRGGEPGWSIYLKHLRGSLAMPGLIAAAIGLAVAGWRVVIGPDRGRWVLTIAFPLTYFAVMATSSQIYGRYTLPLLPFTSLLAALGIVAVASFLASRVSAIRRVWVASAVVLTLAVAAVPASTSVSFDQTLARTSTMDQAYRWIVSQIPPGAKIAIESRVLLLPPTYPSENLPSILARSYDDYVAQGFTYLVASTDGYQGAFAPGAAESHTFDRYRALFGHATEEAAFIPVNDQPGPSLRIFKLNK